MISVDAGVKAFLAEEARKTVCNSEDIAIESSGPIIHLVSEMQHHLLAKVLQTEKATGVIAADLKVKIFAVVTPRPSGETDYTV